MKTKIVFSTFVATAMLLLTAIAIGAFGRPDGDMDVLRYDVLAERVFEGSVENKGHAVEGLLYFPFKTAGDMMEVQIGPKEFVKRSGFKLKPGEMVTVVGMRVVLKDREILLARQVRSMNAVLVVRDHNGQPMWNTDRPIQMDTELPVSVNVYAERCAKCHGENGTPKSIAKGSPRFTDPGWKRPIEEIEATIASGKGKVMPPFNGSLSAEQIHAVAEYLLELKNGSTK
jgi:cytochrome c553